MNRDKVMNRDRIMNRKNVIYNKKTYKHMVIAAMLSLTMLTGCSGESKENQLSYRQIGINSMQSGDYEGAIAAFDSALSQCVGKVGETEIDICYYKAAAQYAFGDVEGALATYDALISYDDKDADAYYMRGCLKLQTGESDKAQEDFASAIKYNSGDYELYINIYENLSAYNLAAEGEEYLNKAFDVKGSDADSLAYRGEIYYLLGQNENALTELKAALDKGSTEANLVIAQVYEALGDSDMAEFHYKEYAKSPAADSEAMCALAEIEMAKQNYAEALSYVNQGLAMEQVTNRRELMQNQIICMEYTGDFSSAWTVIQEYVKMYPDDTKAQREFTFLKNRQPEVQTEGEIVVQGEITAETELEESTEDAGDTEESGQ